MTRRSEREDQVLQNSPADPTVTVKFLHPTLLKNIHDTLSNCYWFKRDLESFLLRAGISQETLKKTRIRSGNATKKRATRALLIEFASDLSNGKTAIAAIVRGLLDQDPDFPHLQSEPLREQRDYVKFSLSRLKTILANDAERATPYRAVQMHLFAETIHSTPRFEAPHSIVEASALERARFRCELCYCPYDAHSFSYHQAPSILPETQERLTVLCGDCNDTFSRLERLILWPSTETLEQYDADTFDYHDRATWPLISDSTVDLQWAEELGLDAWSDYCPECGSLYLDDEVLAPDVICHGCGSTAIGTAFDYETLNLSEHVNMGKPGWRTYQRRLQTDEWRDLARSIKLRDGRCIMCSTDIDLAVHHRTYTRYRRESLDDLVTLCRPCHDLFHFARDVYESPKETSQD